MFKIIYIKLFLILGLILCFSCSSEQKQTIKPIEVIQPNNFDSVAYYRDIIEYDNDLKQHFTAIKYQDSALNIQTAIQFMVEAGLNDIDVNLGVAIKETGLKAGVAKVNNLHGFKKARNRFSWAVDWTASNYCEFQNPFFSFMEFNEYKITGSKIWSTHYLPDTVKKLIQHYQLKSLR